MNKLKKILIIFLFSLIVISIFNYPVNADTNYVTTAYFNQMQSGSATTIEITTVCNSNWNQNTMQAVEIAIVPSTANSQTQLQWIRIGYGTNGEALNKKYTYNVYENCTIYVRYVYWWTISSNYTGDIEFYRSSIVINNDGLNQGLGQVTNVMPTINGQQLTVTWDNVNGADGYDVNFYNKAANINWNYYDCKVPSIGFKAFPIYDGYVVTVKAYKLVNNQKQYGAASNAVTFDIKGATVTLAQVTNVKPVVNGQQLTVTWDSVNGADGYDVNFYNKAANINWNYYDCKVPSIGFKAFPIYDGYVVTVKAYKLVNNQKQYGAASNAVTFDIKGATVTLAQVTNVKPVVNGQQLTVTWDNVNGADGYEIVFTVPGSSNTWNYTITKNSISFSNFPYANGYTVKIKAYKTVNNTKQYGNYSTEVSFDVKEQTAAKVDYVRAYSHEKHLVVFWTKMDNIDGYEINFTVPGTDVNWTYYTDDCALYFKEFPVRDGYNLKIRAYRNVNNTKLYGDYSDITTFNIR